MGYAWTSRRHRVGPGSDPTGLDAHDDPSCAAMMDEWASEVSRALALQGTHVRLGAMMWLVWHPQVGR